MTTTVSRREALTRFGIVAVVVLGLDIVTKVAAVAWLPPAEPVPLFGEVLQLYLIRNPGAAFSMGEGVTWVFTLLAVAVLVFLLSYVVPRLRHGGWAVAVGLVVAGVAGNLIDRLFREPGFAQGHVVDFLRLPYWPIFNIADMGVVCGAILIVYLWLVKGVGYDGVLERDRDKAAAQDADTTVEDSHEPQPSTKSEREA